MKTIHLPHAVAAVALALPVLVFPIVIPAQAQEARPRVVGGGGRVLKTKLDFAEHLDGPAKWQLGTAGTLTLKMDGEATVFLRDGAEEIFRLNPPDYVEEAVASDDGKTLLLVAMKTRGFGADFATLVRVRPNREGKLEVHRVLESGMRLFEGTRWWLADSGAVSNDGATFLGRFGVEEEVPDGSRMHYRWYTVELATGKILGEGLTIANGKAAAADHPAAPPELHPLTRQLLDRLWEGKPDFATLEEKLKKECRTISAADAGVIGRDLILRREALYAPIFGMAAYLASDGTAGNDGLMDFTDCVALLPEDRYRRILRNPDELVNDPVSSGFKEAYLVSEICGVFENALFKDEDGQGYLHHLVLGDRENAPAAGSEEMPEEDVKRALPRLHAKFGHLLRKSPPKRRAPGEKGATLEDLIR